MGNRREVRMIYLGQVEGGLTATEDQRLWLKIARWS